MDTGDARVMVILLVLFMAPQLVSGIHGIYKFTVGVATGALRSQVATLQGVYIESQEEPPSFLDKVDAEADRITLFNELREDPRPVQNLSQDEYAQTINEGLRLLKTHTVQSGKIITFDLANPFNFLTGASPSQGDYSWFHSGRNISKDVHEQAQDLFRDVRYVMVPTFPMDYHTMRLLLEIYGEHLEKEYVVLGKSKYWTLYGTPKRAKG